MSKHWNPEEALAHRAVEDAGLPHGKPSWPEGATAGILLVAASCLALGTVLYQFAGPRQVVEDSVSGR